MGADNIPNKNAAQATNLKAVTAVGKYFAKVKSLTLAGESYSPADLKALFQGEIDANNALDKSRAQLTEQVATTRATKAKASAARKSLKAYILGNYGATAVTMLQDFGMSVPKPTGRKTVAVKAQALAKAEATRKARNTMGKKQKKLIKGAPPQTADAEAQTQGAPANPPGPTTQAQPAPNGTPKSQ